MRTAIVILNWNTKQYLRQFLPGVLSSAGADAEVIVADSASTDGSLEMMREEFPDVRLIVLDQNYGYAEGYDRALETLKKENFDFYVLLNSDIEVRDGWLEPLVSFMDSNPDCAACAPKLHSFYEKDTFEYAGAAGGYLDRYGYPFCRGRVLSMVEKDEGQYDSSAPEVFWATGACLMVRALEFHRLGGLDRRFFAHMEEIDLCWRMQLSGKRICIVTDSLVWHLGGGTLPQNSPWKLRLNFRNDLLMLDNNLAKTLALSALHESKSTLSAAAAKGCRKARRTIFTRMVLDGCSALVYLLTGKASYFKAVLQAHKEYRALRKGDSSAEVEAWLRAGGSEAKVRGMYGRWIVPRAILRKNRIFATVRNLASS